MHSTCSFSSILILFVKMKISLCQLFPRSVHVNYPSTCTHNAHSTHQRGAQYSYELARDRSLLSAQPSVYSDYCSYIHTHMRTYISVYRQSHEVARRGQKRRAEERNARRSSRFPRFSRWCRVSSSSQRVRRYIQNQFHECARTEVYTVHIIRLFGYVPLPLLLAIFRVEAAACC